MDISGLLSTLKWIGAIFPIFNVEFPFHIAYDIIIRLASSWILEDSADEIAGFFNSAFGSAIRYMYDLDQPFLKMCLDMWSEASNLPAGTDPLVANSANNYYHVKRGASITCADNWNIVTTRKSVYYGSSDDNDIGFRVCIFLDKNDDGTK